MLCINKLQMLTGVEARPGWPGWPGWPWRSVQEHPPNIIIWYARSYLLKVLRHRGVYRTSSNFKISFKSLRHHLILLENSGLGSLIQYMIAIVSLFVTRPRAAGRWLDRSDVIWRHVSHCRTKQQQNPLPIVYIYIYIFIYIEREIYIYI